MANPASTREDATANDDIDPLALVQVVEHRTTVAQMSHVVQQLARQCPAAATAWRAAGRRVDVIPDEPLAVVVHDAGFTEVPTRLAHPRQHRG